jgi:hypothetical protein
MDKVHDPDGRAWISQKINVGEYFEEMREKVTELKPVKDTRNVSAKTMMKMMGMEDQALFRQVEQVMKVENLTCEEEVEPMQICDPILENIHGPDIPRFYKTNISATGKRKLKTLFLQDTWLDRTRVETHNNKFKQRRVRQSKHDNDHWFTAEKPPTPNTNWDLTDRATLFCVRVYRPFKHLAPYQYGQTSVKYSQEIWLLGHHTLTDLRELISCPADLNAVGPQQVDTVTRPALRADQVYKSGFFYIEGTFYNDLREPDSIDYSEVVRGWAEDPGRGVGPFATGDMETQRLDGLELRLGYPYLYQHQGNHEHLVSFVDVRLVGPGDPQTEASYPLVRSVGSQMPKYCDICQTCIAVWVCKDHARVPNDPSFFCGLCYGKFNFIDRKRVGSFEEFRYFDVNVI